jgi:hypothetical protein
VTRPPIETINAISPAAKILTPISLPGMNDVRAAAASVPGGGLGAVAALGRLPTSGTRSGAKPPIGLGDLVAAGAGTTAGRARCPAGAALGAAVEGGSTVDGTGDGRVGLGSGVVGAGFGDGSVGGRVVGAGVGGLVPVVFDGFLDEVGAGPLLSRADRPGAMGASGSAP